MMMLLQLKVVCDLFAVFLPPIVCVCVRVCARMCVKKRIRAHLNSIN